MTATALAVAGSSIRTLFDRLNGVIASFAAAAAATSADLDRAERDRRRRIARDTAEAHAIAARYAGTQPGFAADIRAAIDRYESSAASR